VLDEQLPQIKSATHDPAFADRRRPGRRFYLIPELRRLLQRDGSSSDHRLIADDHRDQEPDQLKPFTGIMVAVGLSVPIWMTIAVLLCYLT
jgi:hypothetical protein